MLMQNQRKTPGLKILSLESPLSEFNSLAPGSTKSALRIASDILQARSCMAETILPIDKGPYRDKEGRLAEFVSKRFCRSAFPDGDSLAAGIVRAIIDERQFMVDESLPLPNVLPTPGEMLSQEKERRLGSKSGSGAFHFVDVVEVLSLSTAVLRQRGFRDAFPAFSFEFIESEKKTGSFIEPLIAVYGNFSEELMPFKLVHFVEKPADATQIVLIGDEVMSGLQSGVLAKIRANRYIKRAMPLIRKEHAVDPEDMKKSLGYVSEALYDCYKSWPESFFIDEMLSNIERVFKDKLRSGRIRKPASVSSGMMKIIHNGLYENIMQASHGFLGTKSN